MDDRSVAVIQQPEIYLPPPAQAQAHPAQAHAQAQERPPPPLEEWLPVLLTTGTGLVLLVMPEVKAPTSPSTRLEKPCTPVTTEAAKVAPGMLVPECPPMAGAATLPPVPSEPVDTGR
jgi:hypothetical protein